MYRKEYEVHPSECPHPESTIRRTVDLTAGGLEVNRCTKCGFNFHIIGTHERIVLEGDYLDDADYHCRACGTMADNTEYFRQYRCEPSATRAGRQP